MGGHDAGNVASSVVVDALNEVEKPKALSEFVTAVENRILEGNQRLLEYSDIMLDGRTVGSTFICLLIYGQIGVCLWTGDSRLYLLRGQEFTQLSRDHSAVAELLRAGAITEEEAINHPDANVITRAVGTNEDLCIDLDVFSLQVGDTLLLCSDGLYNSLDKERIIDALQAEHPSKAVANLIDGALEMGASDNVSVVVVKGIRRPYSQNAA